MVKSIDLRKFHRKKERRKRIRRQIKFIRSSYKRQSPLDTSSFNVSSITKETEIESKSYLNISFLNAVFSFVNKNNFQGKNIDELIENLFHISNTLSMNINIFTTFALLIEYYKQHYEYNWDFETTFYIALVAKDKFYPDFIEKKKNILDHKKFNDMKLKLAEKEISFKEMNQRIKELKPSSNITQKNVIFDYNSMINHICGICDTKKEEDNNIETGEINNQKNNQLYYENKNSNENDETEEHKEIVRINENYDELDIKNEINEDIDVTPPYGLDMYDEEKLPEENFDKLDDSYHQINLRQIYQDSGYQH